MTSMQNGAAPLRFQCAARVAVGVLTVSLGIAAMGVATFVVVAIVSALYPFKYSGAHAALYQVYLSLTNPRFGGPWRASVFLGFLTTAALLSAVALALGRRFPPPEGAGALKRWTIRLSVTTLGLVGAILVGFVALVVYFRVLILW